MDINILRATLDDYGYEIRYREDNWIECMLAGDGESWVGQGLTKEVALLAAVRKACSTALAARFLIHALKASGANTKLTNELSTFWFPAVTQARRPLSDLDNVVSRAKTTPYHEGLMVPRPDSRPEPTLSVHGQERPGSSGQVAVIVSRPSPTSRVTSATFPSAAMSDQIGEESQITDPEEALEELDILMDRIRDTRQELGLCAPDRQRLAMLAWICLGRSHTDAFPDDLRIRDRVSGISRQLTEIGKTFWPGSVTALQLHMQPRDLPRHLLGGIASTWRRAAELAEQSLRTKELEDQHRGYDIYGWADVPLTGQHPSNPDKELEDLEAEIIHVSGSLDLQAAPSDNGVRPEGVIFQRWVRQLRWLRQAGVDPERWARIAGRLRWWSFRREPALHNGSRELEPSYIPTTSWSSLLGQDPEKQEHDRELKRLLTEELKLESTEDAVQWLKKALPFSETHYGNILQLATPFVEHILPIEVDEFPETDRRLKRRLQRLQDDLKVGNTEIIPGKIPEVDVEETATSDEDAKGKERIPSNLIDRIRPVTEGKRSVFVSNRRDPELQAQLQEAFGFETLDFRIAEARRMQQLGELIADDEYDMVLGATGFQSHTLDTVLAKACRSAGVQYVRVNDGRPLSCLRAVARDFGR
jgi:hypothetical protein